MKALLPGSALLAVAACLPAHAIAASPGITSQPSFFPDFKRAVDDYVVRCPDRSLTVAVRRAHGASVAVDDRRVAESRTVPIQPGEEVTIRVRHGDRVTRHFVRCLPDGFPAWHWRGFGPQTPGWYVLTPVDRLEGGHRVMIFDHHGVPVWWYRSPAGEAVHDARLIGGDIAYAETNRGSFGRQAWSNYRIIRPNGTLVRSIQSVGSPTDFHDLKPLGRDYLVLTYRPREHVDLSPYGGPSDATVLDSEIQRINRRGRVVWSWNSSDHIGLQETETHWPFVLQRPETLPDGSQAYDPTHINSVEPVGRDLIISLRNTDAVYRIRMRDGRVRWKLGGTRTPRSLHVAGDPADYPLASQHDARLWRGTVTIHDNGTLSDRPPRVVRYAIDTKRRRAILRESVMDPRATASDCCGSARKLPNGDWLVGWGTSEASGENFSALLTPSGRLLSRLTLEGGLFSYRTVFAPARAISAASLRAGMDALYAAGTAD